MARLLDEEELTKQSYNKSARVWAPRHLTPAFWGDQMQKFQALLPSGRVLEIGCGGGRDAKELMELGYDYLGTDISSGLINEAKKINPGVEFKEVSLYDLDFKEKFDGFWCAAVLLHIPKSRINEALQSIQRNMKKDAIGFIAIKEGDDERVEHDSPEEGGDRLFVYWRNRDFLKALKDNGYEVMEHGYRPMSERTKWLTYLVRLP